MYLEQQDHAFVKSNLKRMIKIIEIQRSVLKRQRFLEKVYSKYFALHKQWNRLCAEELMSDMINDDKPKSVDDVVIDDVTNDVTDLIISQSNDASFEVKDQNDITECDSVQKEEERSEFFKEEEGSGVLIKMQGLFCKDIFIEDFKSINFEIEESLMGINELHEKVSNEEKLCDGYKFVLGEKKKSLVKLQEKLLSKYSEEIKIMKMLEGLTKDTTNLNYQKHVEAILNSFYSSDGSENSNSGTVNLDDFLTISQLQWSIENVEQSRLRNLFDLYDTHKEKNEILDEICEQQERFTYLKVLETYKDKVIVEDLELFEDESNFKSNLLEKILFEPTKKRSLNITSTESLLFEKNKLRSELNDQSKIKGIKFVSDKSVRKHYSFPDLTRGPTDRYDCALSGEILFSKRMFADTTKNSANGFFFTKNESSPRKSTRKDLIEDFINSNMQAVNTIAERPIAAVKPLLKNESNKTADLKSFISVNLPLTKTNSHKKKQYRSKDENSLTDEDRLSESVVKENISSDSNERQTKSASLPARFKNEFSITNFQSVHIDGELLKIADFKIGDKHRLSVRSQPRKLSFKRRNSGSDFLCNDKLI